MKIGPGDDFHGSYPGPAYQADFLSRRLVNRDSKGASYALLIVQFSPRICTRTTFIVVAVR